jgi:phospholipid/cholesterol/gamma-HCH transport system substrate-binding protein
MAELEIKPTPRMRIRISLIVLVAIAIMSTEMYLLAGGAGDFLDRKTTLTTYMPDAAGVNTQSEVRLSGIHIGDVRKIELSGSLDPARVVRAEMRVLTRYLKYIPADSQTDVNADTVVAWKYIDIAEGKSPVPIAENAVLPSRPVPQGTDRTELVQALQDRLARIDGILAEMTTPGSATGRFLVGSDIYDKVVAGVTLGQSTLHSYVNPQSPLGQIVYSADTYNKGHDSLVRIDNMLAAIQNGEGTAGHLFASDDEYNEYLSKLVDLRASLANARAGKGGLGALLENDEGYVRVVNALADVDAKMAAINAGEGSGRLLTNAQLYESLNGSLQHLEALLRDIRENPQKYLRVKLRGR